MVISICTQQGHWGLGFKVVKQNMIDQLTCSASNHQFVYELCSTQLLKYKGKYFNKTILKWNQHKSQGTVIKLYFLDIFIKPTATSFSPSYHIVSTNLIAIKKKPKNWYKRAAILLLIFRIHVFCLVKTIVHNSSKPL